MTARTWGPPWGRVRNRKRLCAPTSQAASDGVSTTTVCAETGASRGTHLGSLGRSSCITNASSRGRRWSVRMTWQSMACTTSNHGVEGGRRDRSPRAGERGRGDWHGCVACRRRRTYQRAAVALAKLRLHLGGRCLAAEPGQRRRRGQGGGGGGGGGHGCGRAPPCRRCRVRCVCRTVSAPTPPAAGPSPTRSPPSSALLCWCRAGQRRALLCSSAC